ncbi:hypothetical protein CDL12_05834 [Handroanthus impetiginosus]|uniref:C2H2-type domain-containing protein n=1 Tax=Handroanthus impetiginosus TaxID=429701 RepID=A0A2G9HVE2_9LAMI|nr:hypothetical protein CDL12_05834 [Handroanthus impetiginosus]
MQSEEEVIMIKGKRSKRPRPPSPFVLTIATNSSTTAEFTAVTAGGVITDDSGSSDRVTPSPSNSGARTDEEEEDMANCLILLARGHRQTPPPPPASEVYQCKTCNKSFPSFQALGGHRASHRIKPNKQEDDSTINLLLQIPNRVLSNHQNKSRLHECSICGAEFASGQALGGHMRRHRPIPAAASSGSYGDQSQEVKRPRIVLSLDLNLPAPEEDDCSESDFGYGPKEQVIVFSTSSLVDCHY